jgi:predicted CoA-binding protein
MMSTRALRRFPTDQVKARLLSSARNIAVIGYSRTASKDSTVTANCLVNAGFNVVGVNPTATELDRNPTSVPMVPSLRAASRWLAQNTGAYEQNHAQQNGHDRATSTTNGHGSAPSIDIVTVFRESSALPEVVAEIKRLRVMPKAVWLPKGVTNPACERELEELGITVVANKCLLSEHIRLRNASKDEDEQSSTHRQLSQPNRL